MAWSHLNPFVKSGEVLRLIGVCGTFDCHCRPSEMMGIEDTYTAFCFDEACAFIIQKIRDGEKPIIKVEGDKLIYRKPSDLYRKYNNE